MPAFIGQALPRKEDFRLLTGGVDALAPFGVTHIELPLTAERVWRAIREAKETA